MTTTESIRSSQNPVMRIINWWFMPRSTEPDTAFRERSLRWAIFTGFMFSTFLLVTELALYGSPLAFPDTDKILFVMVYLTYGLCAALLTRGKANLAAYIFCALLGINIGLDPGMVYWSPLSILATTILTLFYALILPKNRVLLLFVLFQMGAFIVHILNPAISSPLPANAPFSTQESALIASTLYFLGGGMVVYFLLREYIRQRDQLKELVETLETRVSERTEELRLAKAEAEVSRDKALAADRIKSQFLASMSHELRTPLNAILSLTKYMRQGVFGPVTEEQVDYLDKTVDSGEHLLSLINDVLDVTKIQSGMLKLYVEEGFDVAAELEKIAASAEKMLADKPVRLIRDIDPVLPLISCDKRRIRQIIYNLVSNAVKFTETGTITLSAKQRDGELFLAVLDTGPGIKPESRDVIFDPFVQTETGIRHAGGTGLGLPISKELAEAHGGRLWVESAPGEGSTFFVAIPLKTAVVETAKVLA